MRYQMDYAPLLLFASVLGWTMLSQQFDRCSPWRGCSRPLPFSSSCGLRSSRSLSPCTHVPEPEAADARPASDAPLRVRADPGGAGLACPRLLHACPVCASDNERYLFHKLGVRFVRCRSCGLVYANPPAATEPSLLRRRRRRAAPPRSRSCALHRRPRQPRSHRRRPVPSDDRVRPRDEIVLAGRIITAAAPITSVGVTVPPRRRGSRSGHRVRRRRPDRRHISPRPSVLVLNELLEACTAGADRR